jgi:hypothetical protein
LGQAIDAIGNNTSSTVVATQGQTGKLGTCYLFDGSTNKITFSDHANWSISQSTNLSISAWVNFSGNSSSHYQTIWGYSSGPCLSFKKISDNNYQLGWYAGGSESQSSTITFSVSTNTWYLVTMTKSGSTELKLYLNGSLLNTLDPTDIDKDPVAVYIGSDNDNEAFYGKIDELGIWKKVLTSTEVTQLYNTGTGLSYPFGQTYTLTTSVSPSGSGTLNPANGTYSSGQVVSVTATPASGNAFSSWSGAATGSANPVSITMNANKALTATFTAVPTYTLTTTVTPSGSGTLSPAGGTYSSGQVVSVTATPATGHQFSSWSGAAIGSANPVSITMNANKALTATFTTVPTYTLTTTVTPSGSGTLNPASGTYSSGQVVSVTATPATSYQFSSWSGAATGSTNPVSVTMDANKSLTATFVLGSSSNYWQGTTGGIYYNSGNVGIGTTSTLSNLASLEILTNTQPNILMRKNSSSTWAALGIGNDGLGFLLSTNSGSTFITPLFINSTGNVGIGCINPSAKLTVNGGIKATRIDVVTGPCADHVFNTGYKLMNLAELDAFIKANKHLPEVPSADEFKANGYSVGEMDNLLLKKVEELTLYIIELEKKVNYQDKVIKDIIQDKNLTSDDK